jgi:ketosteroid isomerase-like protein
MRTALLALAFLVAGPASGQDDADPAAVAERFYAALAAADRLTVEELLLDESLVLESGGIETREEYFGHHFSADAAFLAAVRREPGERIVRESGDVAWVSSTSRLHGLVGTRPVDVDSAELLVLRRTPAGWRVAAVHWSSRSRD